MALPRTREGRAFLLGMVAMPELLRALRSTETERERLEKEREKLRAKQNGSPRPSTERRAELERDEAACGRQIEGLMVWRAALLARAEGKEPLAELIGLIAERGLGPAPEESAHPCTAWEQWLAAHRDAQPAHLPGVSSPAW